jgi:hypothetical protein
MITEPVTIDATTCRVLNGDYALTNNIYSAGDCITASSSSITLNCAGYTINYSRSSAGCGFVANGYTGINLYNCTFAQGAFNSTSSAAMCLSSGSNVVVTNSTIGARGGANGYDARLDSSNLQMINTSTNSSNSNFSGSSNLYRSWYLNVNLTDQLGALLSFANLQVNDTLNTTDFSQQLSNGIMPTQILVQYLQTGASAFTYYSNYSIYGSTGSSNNITYVNLTSNRDISLPINASVCGVVSSDTTLRNNLYSTGTCFTAGSSGKTLDCAGYTINYSRAGDGYFGIFANGYDSLVLKNCSIVLGNTSATRSYGVYINNSASFQLVNSSINGSAANISSLNAEFINTRFDNSTLAFGDSTSNLSVKWYAYVHTIGLANEDVNNSEVNATNRFGAVAENGTTNQTGWVTFLLTQCVANQSGFTYNDPYNFSAMHPETQAVNFTCANLSSSRNITIGLISASINIDSPNESQIYFQGDDVSISVNETRGQIWVTNVTTTVSGGAVNISNQQATETSPGSNVWNNTYSVDPSQPSATLTITARGYNGTAYVSATRNFIVTRAPGPGVLTPRITYACPYTTYMLQNSQTNVTVNADLDTVLYTFILNVTYPNTTTVTLPVNYTSSELTEYLYNRTWNLNTSQVGTYTLTTEVRDVNDNRNTSTFYAYAVAFNSTVNLSTNGSSALILRDTCSNAILRNDTNFSALSVPAGNYTMVAEDDARAWVSFYRFNVTSFNGTFMNYTRVSASLLTPPTNRRNVFLIGSTAFGGSYSSVGILINYSEDAGTLVAEASLEMNSCAAIGSCIWSAHNSTLDTALKTINTTIANISGIYGLFEPAFPTPEQTPVQVALPLITRLYTGRANAVNNTTVTAYLELDLDASLSAAAVNVTYPSGPVLILSNMSYANLSNYTYNLSYNFTPNETGLYRIFARVNDSYNQNTTAYAYVMVAGSNITAGINATGTDFMWLIDAANNTTILSGANLSGSITPGNYTLIINASLAKFYLFGLYVDQNITALNFTTLATNAATPPGNRSALFMFESQNYTLNYSTARLLINYTSLAGSIITEPGLEVWRCGGLSNCTFSQQAAALNSTFDYATAELSNLSGVYGLFQPAQSVPVQVAAPAITRFYANRTNVLQNAIVAVYLEADLDAAISSAAVNVSAPSWNMTLTNISFANASGYLYNYSYSFTANETGTYTLWAWVSDSLGQNATSNITVFASAASIPINITSYGDINLSVVDPGTNQSLLNGTNISGSITPGNYTILANASRLQFTFQDVQLTGSMSMLNFTDLATGSITPPSNRTSLYVFEAANFTVNYSLVRLVLSYNGLQDAITSEDALEVWTCPSTSNCTNMTRLNATVDATANTVNLSLTRLSSVYALMQAAQTITETVTQTQIVTQTSSSSYPVVKKVNVEVPVPVDRPVNVEVPVEVPVPKYTSMRLLSGPRFVELKPGESITSDISIANNLDRDLTGIELSAEGQDGLEAHIDQETLDLAQGASSVVTITLTATKEGSYRMQLSARSPELDLTDTLAIPVHVGYNLEADKQRAKERIDFAKQLIGDNPECLDLTESVLTAALFIDSGEYGSAEEKAQRTIAGCSSIIALRGKPIITSSMEKIVDWPLALMVAIGLAGLVGAIGLFLFMFLVGRGNKKFGRQHGAHAEEKYAPPAEKRER